MRRAEPNGGSAHSGLEAGRDRRGPKGSGVRPCARRFRVGLEALEGRQLLAGSIGEHPQFSPSAAPAGITAGLVSESSSPTPGGATDFITFGGSGFENFSVLAFNDAGTAAGDGYLRDVAGNITIVAVPGLNSSIVTDINNAGTSVGYNTFGYGPGFVRDAAGNFTTFQIPGIPSSPGEGIFSAFINDAGTIAGSYESPAGSATHGFLRDLAGNITTFDVPGASFTRVTDINNAGTIIGSYSPGSTSYLRDAAGDISTISVPGSDSTYLTAINNFGTVAGSFNAGGQIHGFLRDAAGRFTTFDIAGDDSSIIVTSINDLGMVAGVFGTFDQRRAFVRDAAGNITTFDPTPGAFVSTALLNNVGNLAGTAYNLNAHSIGFVETQVTSTQTQVTAEPNPASVGQPVTFTAVVTPGPGGVAPTGGVSFAVDGGAATIVPLNLVGGRMQASLTVSTLSEGSHTVVASYGRSPGLAASSGVQVLDVILPPAVISVRRSGFHADPTRIVLGFSTGLDPDRAQDVRNYRIVGPTGQVIAVDRATYSAATGTVILKPHGRLDLHRIYRLTVNGSSPDGITSPSGVLLDGAGKGAPGSDYVTEIKAADLVLGTSVPGGPARLASLRAVLAKIEAAQARSLAGAHLTSRTHKAAISASSRPMKLTVQRPVTSKSATPAFINT